MECCLPTRAALLFPCTHAASYREKDAVSGTYIEGWGHSWNVNVSLPPPAPLVTGAGPERCGGDGVAGHDVNVQMVNILTVHEVPEGQAVLAAVHVGGHQASFVTVTTTAGCFNVDVVATWRMKSFQFSALITALYKLHEHMLLLLKLTMLRIMVKAVCPEEAEEKMLGKQERWWKRNNSGASNLPSHVCPALTRSKCMFYSIYQQK